METDGSGLSRPRRREALNPAGLEANGNETSRRRKKNLKNAAKAASTLELPREHGADHMRDFSAALARDLDCEYLEAKFTGEEVRCPISPIGETAIVHDKLRVNLHHTPQLSGSSVNNSNLTLVFPLLDGVVYSTASGPATFPRPDPTTGAGIGLTTRFRCVNSDGSNFWNISNDVAFYVDAGNLAQYPIALSDGNHLSTGYQVIDYAYISTIVPAQTEYRIRGTITLDDTNETAGYNNWTLNVGVAGADGTIPVPSQRAITLASGGTEFTAGRPWTFDTSANDLPITGADEAMVFWLTSPYSIGTVQVEGTLSFSFVTHDGTTVATDAWRVPGTMRLLQGFSASTLDEVKLNKYAVRTLASLFTFDGPMISQGGFVAITEVKAQETISKRDLTDWAGSRERSYHGKIIEGAYGVWVEDTLSDFKMRSLCKPYMGDTKYLLCASTITDTSQTTNLVALVDLGYEFTTNSLLYEKSFAVPAAYPQLMHLVISSMPRFSSNEGHEKEVVGKAIAVRRNASVSRAKPTPWWRRLINGVATVGKAVLPYLPQIIAAL